MQKSTYANGDTIRYVYTYSGLLTDIYHDDNNATSSSSIFTFNYDSDGTPRYHWDKYVGLKYDYSYDSIGRLIRTNISKTANNSYVGSTEYGYDLRNNLTSITNNIGGESFTQLYGYGKTSVADSDLNAKDNLPTIYTILETSTNYHYDGLNRLTKREVGISGNPITNAYSYKMNGSYHTNQLATETIEGTAYNYEYDNVGNITKITKAGANYRVYTYDSLNRLLTESDYVNKQITTYTYNHLGNITKKQIDTYTNTTLTGTPTTKTISYTYGNDGKTGWNYLLTGYDANSNGTVDTAEKISYDAIGNPVSYRGAALAWYGRQLKSFTKNGITSTMTYDADGLRSSKTVNGSKTEYQYVGDKLFYEKRGDGNSFYYFYDSYGKLSAIYHYVNGTKVPYHVVTNAQGDVMALYNWSGTKVAEYSYDAWGNCSILSDTTSTHIATLNPFRYRGYYRDTDLGLYYLQSRYYDSEIGRFINSDNVTDSNAGLMGFNTYVYCGNNPVSSSDPSGHGAIRNILKLLSHNAKNSIGYITGFLKSIKASVGGGMGIGVKAEANASGVQVGGELSAKVIDSVGLSNGKFQYETQTTVNANFSVAEIINVGTSKGYRHSLLEEGCTCDILHGKLAERHSCPASQQFKDDEFQLGVSFGLYLGIGGEVNLGVDIIQWEEAWNQNYLEHQKFLGEWRLFDD